MVTKLPIAGRKAGQIVRATGRRTMDFTGRAEPLRLWDQLDANQLDGLLRQGGYGAVTR